ncbi:hypothetical protein MJO28_009694 [Puccinia striiformis f. sp. tritici]|uniref:Uncharacterized protein n=1 Tax=Puccinia striiformis f. sp. tritici TaxID=168172 RepID=A0ACC0EA18_9BASI|nr:hypothetical protein MJO28_009694 [Puccinia striiformis f. sp. tritici]
MSAENTNQPPNGDLLNQLPLQFQMLINTAVDKAVERQAAIHRGEMKQMIDHFTGVNVNSDAQSSGASNNNRNLPAVTQSKSKQQPPSNPIPKPSVPPKKPVTRRAQAVATNLKRQNSTRAKSVPLPPKPSTATPKKARSGTSFKKQATTVKKQPNQMTLKDYPADFLDTKECIFTHIKLLWGMFEVRTPPPPANPELVRQFCSTFKDVSDFERHVDNANAAQLVAAANVQTLKDARWENQSIRRWGPNLEEGQESLFNSACRIAALNTFLQMAGAGGYDFMGFNHAYRDDVVLSIKTYDHFVHHLSSKKFCAEVKEPGKYAKKVEPKNISGNHSRLRTDRYKFAVNNKYPNRYLKMINDINANSDDEWDPLAKCFSIRTLSYRSHSGNIFFRRLDQVMRDSVHSRGNSPGKRTRRLPQQPIISTTKIVPIHLALDFYHQGWLRDKSISEQQSIPDVTQVAFLPDPTRSLLPENHPRHNPEERLNDSDFNQLYLKDLIKLYGLDVVTEAQAFNVDNEDDEAEPEEDIGDDKSDVEHEDEDDGHYEEGNWGDYYGSDEDGEFDDKDEEDKDDDDDDSRMQEDGGDDTNYGDRHLNDAEEDAINEEHGL